MTFEKKYQQTPSLASLLFDDQTVGSCETILFFLIEMYKNSLPGAVAK
jgi:hypothetical protein